jgi:hypothetical protein
MTDKDVWKIEYMSMIHQQSGSSRYPLIEVPRPFRRNTSNVLPQGNEPEHLHACTPPRGEAHALFETATNNARAQIESLRSIGGSLPGSRIRVCKVASNHFSAERAGTDRFTGIRDLSGVHHRLLGTWAIRGCVLCRRPAYAILSGPIICRLHTDQYLLQQSL